MEDKKAVKYLIQNVGRQIALDIEPQVLTIEEAVKLVDTLQHCIKKAVQARDESENTGRGVDEATK